jgi:hypothetical protein
MGDISAYSPNPMNIFDRRFPADWDAHVCSYFLKKFPTGRPAVGGKFQRAMAGSDLQIE